MADLEITRTFKAAPDKVFAVLTQPENLLDWWGPVGVHVKPTDLSLDLTKPGPWGSVMENDEGGTYKVTGHVTHVDPPKSVGFTWAWHDEDDRRGHESHVMFTVEPAPGGGSLFRLNHVDLADAEMAERHQGGWTSSLSKLDPLVAG